MSDENFEVKERMHINTIKAIGTALDRVKISAVTCPNCKLDFTPTWLHPVEGSDNIHRITCPNLYCGLTEEQGRDLDKFNKDHDLHLEPKRSEFIISINTY